jgi:hypothetical protein
VRLLLSQNCPKYWEKKLDLKARRVIAVEPHGIQVDIRAQESRIPVALGMHHDHHLEVPLQLHMVYYLLIQHDVIVVGIELLKAG